MEGSLPLKGGPIGYLKSINRSSLDSGICLTPDPFRSHSGRKLKAVLCPYPHPGLSQNITFGAAFNIAYSESSTTPQVLDEHHKRLNKKLLQTFNLLQLSGVLEYEGANLLCGSFFGGKSEIRQMSELPFFNQTRGYTRAPVTIDRLQQAIQLRKGLEEMDSTPDEFKRFKWGWKVLIDGLQKEHGEERIHQFVRSLEALILPEIGRTKRQFTHRCQTFARAGPNTKQILEEAFELRSMAEHLNDWEQALGPY